MRKLTYFKKLEDPSERKEMAKEHLYHIVRLGWDLESDMVKYFVAKEGLQEYLKDPKIVREAEAQAIKRKKRMGWIVKEEAKEEVPCGA